MKERAANVGIWNEEYLGPKPSYFNILWTLRFPQIAGKIHCALESKADTKRGSTGKPDMLGI